MLESMHVKRIPPQPVVSIRRQIRPPDIGKHLMDILPEVGKYLDHEGIEPAGPPFTRYHAISAKSLDMDAGFPVGRPQRGEGVILADSLPGGRAAAAWHVGPYDKLGDSWLAFFQWIKGRHRPLKWGWEVYWSWAESSQSTSQDRTELVMPIW
jgi:effector-binding domain-containing protein